MSARIRSLDGLISTQLADSPARLRVRSLVSEHDDQVALFTWAGLAMKQNSELAMLFAIPNQGAGRNRRLQEERRIYATAVCRSFEEARDCILNYVEGRF